MNSYVLGTGGCCTSKSTLKCLFIHKYNIFIGSQDEMAVLSFPPCVNNLKQAPKTGAQKIFLRYTKVRRLKHSLLSPLFKA